MPLFRLTKSVAILTMAAWLTNPCLAASISELSVKRKGNQYILHGQATVKTDIVTVYRLITDYANLQLVNPYLTQSDIVQINEDGSSVVDLVTRTCVFLICRNLKHRQIFYEVGDTRLVAEIVPQESDFRFGQIRWQLHAESGGTRISLSAVVEPDFIIAPVIGPYLIRTRMIEMTLATVNNLEK